MKSSKLNLFSVLVLVTLLASVFVPDAIVRAQDTRGVLVPAPYSPHGTITDRTPTYKWSKVTGATIYQYQVWKGTTKVLDKLPDSSICGSTTCEKTLGYTLGYNLFKWRVRAYKGGYWSAWSPYMDFNVSPGGFYSTFNNEMDGWAKKAGKDWYKSTNYIYTNGLADKWSSIYRPDYQYTDITYTARMKRPSGYSRSYLAMRMGTKVDAADGTWWPGYYFGYDNYGTAAIYKIDNSGVATNLYTSTTSLVNKFGWNTIQVKAIGWKFWFYINGCLVTFLTDTTLPRGYVGITAYRMGSDQEVIYVDKASLVINVTPQ